MEIAKKIRKTGCGQPGCVFKDCLEVVALNGPAKGLYCVDCAISRKEVFKGLES
jgi:hypothetical protein